MKVKLLALLAVFVLAVSGSIATTSDAYDADDAMPTIKDVDFYKLGVKMPTKVSLRYYSDMPNVPYIGVSQLYNIYQGEVMTIAPGSDGKYTVKNGNGSAVFDLKNGIIHSDDYRMFSKMLLGEAFDSPCFLKKVDESSEGSKAATINYSDYHIKAYYADGEIFMPLPTVADLYMGVAGFMTIYVPETSESSPAMYVVNSTLLVDVPKILNPDYLSGLYSMAKDGERTEDMARFSYDNLCFYLDNFYGKVSSSYIGGQMKTKTLDQILTESNDSNLKQIKEWLQSTSLAQYCAGMISLQAYLFDNGHTQADVMIPKINDAEEFPELADAIQTELKKVELPSHFDKTQKTEDIKAARNTVWSDAVVLGGEDTYYEKGDTAVFTFNQFFADEEAWNAYVPGSTEYPDDSIGHFEIALNKAEANSNIKNFVIDLSTNTGGMSEVLLFIMATITGDYASQRNLDVQTGTTYVEKYHVDTNLDGKFDEKDLKKQYDFKFAILTTNLSFSCGNLLPVYAKDEGIMIIGEKSGGGICNIMLGSTSDGLFGTYSSYSALATKSGADVEAGAVPDKVLIDSSTTDYSVLYDMDTLSLAINDFYKESDNTILYIAIALVCVVVMAAVTLFVKKRNTV